MSEPTLDTAAIRAMFDGAVVGFNGNQILILIPILNGRYLNLIGGDRYSEARLNSLDWLIRPGDECEFEDIAGTVFSVFFDGFSGDLTLPFRAKLRANFESGCRMTSSNIRPLPAPAVEQTVEQKAVQLAKDMAAFVDCAYPISMGSFIQRAAALFGEEE